MTVPSGSCASPCCPQIRAASDGFYEPGSHAFGRRWRSLRSHTRLVSARRGGTVPLHTLADGIISNATRRFEPRERRPDWGRTRGLRTLRPNGARTLLCTPSSAKSGVCYLFRVVGA
jgi:hypothetical protein